MNLQVSAIREGLDVPARLHSRAYHRHVSPFAVVALAVVALAVGLVVGAWLHSVGERRREETVEPPPVEVAAVLGALRATAILLDENLDLIELSPSAYAYRLVRPGGMVHPDLVRLATAAQRSSQPQMADLTLERGRGDAPSVLAVRATELPGGPVLLLCEDRTQASRAEEARRDFVANISHELKTPIGAIGLLTEAVDDAADDPESVHRFAQRLQRESARLVQAGERDHRPVAAAVRQPGGVGQRRLGGRGDR